MSTLIFSAALKAQLDAIAADPNASKSAYSSAISAALGATRRLRFYRDANPSATDPAVTGMEFLNVGMTGTMTFAGGNIASFGSAHGVTRQLAADLSSGKCAWRIEGNGAWIQGSLGLTAAAQVAAGMVADVASAHVYDYMLGANMTATAGIGFAPSAQLLAPRFMWSGAGSVAPARTNASPRTIEFYDWTNQSAPTLACIVTIDNRIDNWVFEDGEMQTSNGDSAVYQSSADAVFGKFRIGATMTISHQQNTEANTAPLHQVVVAFTYAGSEWADYPNADTGYDRKNTILNLPPCKSILKDGDGNVLYTWEMPDGSPMNDPAHFTIRQNQPQRFDPSNIGKAWQPDVNAYMGLFWESATPRVSDIAHKVYPGIDTTRYRPSKGRLYLGYAACEPAFSGTGNNSGGTINGQGHPWMASRYPLPRTPLQTIVDQYCGTQMTNSGNGAYTSGWVEGYDYTAAGIGLHDWYTGPGGPRQSRCVYPSTFAYYLSYPDAVQPQNGAPWKDIAHGYRKNYWNHANLWVRSASTLRLDDNAVLLGNGWALKYNYYGDYAYTGPAIAMNGDQNGGTSDHNFDANGNLIINAWARDDLHDYSNRGMAALLFNSPMHAIGSKFDTVTSFILHRDPAKDMSSEYLVRSMAWQWLHHVIAWKNASRHPLGFSQAEIEARFNIILQSLYDYVYKPAFIDNDPAPLYQSIRNLGIPTVADPSANQWTTPGGRLGTGYMSHVLVLMKQTGFWDRMYNLNITNHVVLDNLIRNMDKFVFDNILDTSGAPTFTSYFNFGPTVDGGGNPVAANIPASWAAWQALGAARSGDAGNPASDFIHDGSGAYAADTDVGNNLWRGYAYMRPQYFPEYPNARLNDAIAKFDAYEATITAAVNAASAPYDKALVDHRYEYPGVAVIKAPA